jgi:hypothetical protein
MRWRRREILAALPLATLPLAACARTPEEA